MLHLKCEHCRTRLYDALSDDPAGELCLGCGRLLEPVGDLAELVGFQLVRPDRDADGTAPSGTQAGES